MNSSRRLPPPLSRRPKRAVAIVASSVPCLSVPHSLRPPRGPPRRWPLGRIGQWNRASAEQTAKHQEEHQEALQHSRDFRGVPTLPHTHGTAHRGGTSDSLSNPDSIARKTVRLNPLHPCFGFFPRLERSEEMLV